MPGKDGRLARGQLAVARTIGIDAWLNERLFAYQRLECSMEGRAEVLVEFALRPRWQTLCGERGVDGAREGHTRVNENAVEVEQHCVVISHTGRSCLPVG